MSVDRPPQLSRAPGRLPGAIHWPEGRRACADEIQHRIQLVVQGPGAAHATLRPLFTLELLLARVWPPPLLCALCAATTATFPHPPINPCPPPSPQKQQQQRLPEPLLDENPDRYCMFPIK